ncbi:MAG TPA: mannose-1-phosphate guanylyltransferase [Terriglobales bacterium]|nr:mannose-1-phosphate guanylyltransferase [Terriglobales bacterium]
MPKTDLHFYPVILAGGRGTRFWPMSRKRRAKQLLALDGRETMIQQTVRRLLPLAPAKHCWVITNHDLHRELVRQLPRLSRRQIIPEPVGRNTAPAVGLAAFLLLRRDPAALIGMFPSDHVIEQESGFQELVRKGIEIARSGENIVALGIRPTRAETGYGYIEAGAAMSPGVLRVLRFTEKPDRANARKFLEAGNYYWNSGMFLWSASTLAKALAQHLPKTAAILEQIAATYGTDRFVRVFSRLYPQCENISIDYAVLEPRSAKGEHASGIFCLPAECGWKDLGSWTALHEHHVAKRQPADGNLISGAGTFALDAENNYIHAPGKFVAAVGVNNLVVVETEDALLITTREQAQDVGKVVKYLDDKKLHKLV